MHNTVLGQMSNIWGGGMHTMQSITFLEKHFIFESKFKHFSCYLKIKRR